MWGDTGWAGFHLGCSLQPDTIPESSLAGVGVGCLLGPGEGNSALEMHEYLCGGS